MAAATGTSAAPARAPGDLEGTGAPAPPPESDGVARLKAFGAALGKQPHLQAVRDGVVGALPLILLGSGFLLLAQPPWPGLARYLPPIDALKAAWRGCAGLVSLYACAACALSLAKRRETDVAAAVTTSLAVLLLAQHPQPLTTGGLGLPLAGLGAAGLFPAFAAAILSVEVLAFFQRKQWGIKLSGGAPEVVVRSFAALLPSATCALFVWALVHLAGVDLAGGIGRIFAPLVSASDALPALWAVVLIDSCLWMIGIHGLSVLAAVRPLWLAALAENMQAAVSGGAPTHLATQEFFVWFVWQGGSGATLALAILLLFARSKQLRLVGRAGFVPALFNINEPLLFGTPVVLNGKLAVPFILGPVLMTATTWAAMRLGFVRLPIAEVVWTLPAPVGAFLATGGDLRAVALQMGNLALALALWWPFLRRYDRALVEAEGTSGK
jgi:PTS system cellobiose-specific IIC component